MTITKQPITSSVVLTADDLCTILNVPAVQEALGFPAVTISGVEIVVGSVTGSIKVDFAMERIERPAHRVLPFPMPASIPLPSSAAAPILTQDDLDQMDPVEMARASYAEAAKTLGVDVR